MAPEGGALSERNWVKAAIGMPLTLSSYDNSLDD